MTAPSPIEPVDRSTTSGFLRRLGYACRSPSRKARQRNPSHLGSKSQSSPGASALTASASIGGYGGRTANSSSGKPAAGVIEPQYMQDRDRRDRGAPTQDRGASRVPRDAQSARSAAGIGPAIETPVGPLSRTG